MQAHPNASSTAMMAMPGMGKADPRPGAHHYLPYVVGDDGGDDAAERLADRPSLCTARPDQPCGWNGPTSGMDIYRWLSRALVRIRRDRDLAARFVGSQWPPVADADSPNRGLAGVLFLLAGIYQWLPIKSACLDRCRVPLQTLLSQWRPGVSGAFRMGADHGVFCLGCCWALMLLMFAGGAMDLLWVTLIAGFILVEKLFPNGKQIGRVSGICCRCSGHRFDRWRSIYSKAGRSTTPADRQLVATSAMDALIRPVTQGGCRPLACNG